MRLLFAILLIVCLIPSYAQESILVLNVSQNTVEMGRNADVVRPIASITKLMTAMTTLDWDKDLSRRLPLTKKVHSHLPRQTYNRYQLLMAMLIRSDNAAAETLAEDYPGGRPAFILAMNRKAREWGMHHTHFADASGLSSSNISTARDVAIMVEAASGYWIIQDATQQKQIAIELKAKKKVRTLSLPHTSGPLLFVFDQALVSKTGLTSPAGWCVGMMAQQSGQKYIVVVLGSKSKQRRLDLVKDIRYNHFVDKNLFDTPIPNNY
jgi:serine-type D-Ala-D-Ala endopeptidase (penicillin-binding protein 7)